MPLSLVQLKQEDGARIVAAFADDGNAYRLNGVRSSYELAQRALDQRQGLAQVISASLSSDRIDVHRAADAGRLLSPIDHPDPAHVYLTGTGLTHLGSAEGRDKMHKAAAGGTLTDSMRMFLMGMEGGKRTDGQPGAQPEWFYKGDGSCLIGPGADLPSPAFAQDGSEEPEIAGVYLIDREGNPRRLGFCLGNEFSDHITERGNYLWLAHSKIRPAAIGPELMTGEIPHDIRGTSRILRNGEKLWEKSFLTGETNMSHSIANLEHHHFKYALFRRPGDIHVHFFGTATLSFSDGITTQPGDIFEIEAPPFHLPLRNRLGAARATTVAVQAL